MDLAEILAGKQQEMVQSNPFYIGGANVLQGSTNIDPYKFNDPWAGVAAQIGTALLGSAATAYGKRQGEQEYKDFMIPIQQAFRSPDPTSYLKGQDGEYGDIINVLLAQDRDRQMQSQSMMQDLAGKAIQEYVKNPNPRSAELVKVLAEKGGMSLDGFGVESGQSQLTPVGDFARPVQGMNQVRLPDGVNRPVSVRDKVMQTAQILQDQNPGLTPNAAIDSAEKLHKAELEALAGTNKKAEAAREYANSVMGLADTADMYVKQAGDTGGVGGYGSGLQNKLTALAGLFSPSQANKLTATQQLDSLRADVIAKMRPKGVGAMSDAEMRAYLSAGPSSINEPGVNQEIIDKLRTVGQYEKEYADFLDWHRMTFQSMDGADAAWQAYKSQNPPILFDEQTGKGSWNTERVPWTQFFNSDSFGPSQTIAPKMDFQRESSGGLSPEEQAELAQLEAMRPK